MLKLPITYTDFDEEERTETFYFNFTTAELTEMEVTTPGGLSKALERIVASSDNKAIFEEFKSIILQAYGIRSEDGRRFIKSEQISKEFTETPAFSVLIVDLFSKENFAEEFINKLMPAEALERLNARKDIAQPQDRLPKQEKPSMSVVEAPETVSEDVQMSEHELQAEKLRSGAHDGRWNNILDEILVDPAVPAGVYRIVRIKQMEEARMRPRAEENYGQPDTP